MLTNTIVVTILEYMHYIYQISVVYTLNLNNVTCQLYFNRAEKKEPMRHQQELTTREILNKSPKESNIDEISLIQWK